MALLASVVALPGSAGSQPPDAQTPFRIVVLPDTQIYAQSDPGGAIAQGQAQWVVDTATATNTIFVTHVGDVVQNPNDTTEWDRVEPAFDLLDAAAIPYAIAPGNHDLVDGGGPVLYDQRFATGRFVDQPWFGASHTVEGNRSSWQMFAVPGHDLLFVHLRHLVDSYGSVPAVLTWLDEVLTAHPDHLVFVTTHEFTESDGSILIPALTSTLTNHCNVALVLSGHRPGEAARGTFDDDCGRTVHHVLTNYQFIDNGGDGYLRTLDVDPLSLEMTSQVYSPTLDATRDGADEAFTVTLDKLVPVPGDANCDRRADVVDALVIAQHAVGLRADRGSCPLLGDALEIDASASDVDGSEDVDIVDALLIAQCDAGLTNPWCPD